MHMPDEHGAHFRRSVTLLVSRCSHSKDRKKGRLERRLLRREPAAVDYQALPAAVFTDPEIGTVGLTENEAANKGMTPVTGEFQFQASGRALTANRAEGFVRIIATKETERVIGAQVVGPEASKSTSLTCARTSDICGRFSASASTVHTHPTLSPKTMATRSVMKTRTSSVLSLWFIVGSVRIGA